ncbi:MAG: response regulator [Fimbriimonadaceae bacterium]|nr:response regulator [Chitinophagales bacterium]
MKKILLIEDNSELRENTAEILELANYKVFTAENGKIGVDIAIQENPDIIICDIMMPVLDGYGVIHLLGMNENTKNIPFIFLTAKTEKTDFRKGMEMGADDYITKPFDDIELLKAVETRLKKNELLKQSFSNDVKGLKDFIDNAQTAGGLELTSEIREITDYKKKQQLYSEGKKPHYVYYVIKGKIKAYMINDVGKELITSMYVSGDFIGYTSILEDKPYADNAEVLEDAELMLIPGKDFLQLISNDRLIAQQFIKLLTKNVVENEEKLISLAYNSLRKRVAAGLMEVYDKFKTVEPGMRKVEISRDNLARIIGTAKESLIRTLSDFKEEKLIEIQNGKIHILDENKLRFLPY